VTSRGSPGCSAWYRSADNIEHAVARSQETSAAQRQLKRDGIAAAPTAAEAVPEAARKIDGEVFPGAAV
jgi:hypothetical protein